MKQQRKAHSSGLRQMSWQQPGRWMACSSRLMPVPQPRLSVQPDRALLELLRIPPSHEPILPSRQQRELANGPQERGKVNEIPGVIPLVPAGVAGDFSFDDYPPALTPGLSLVLVFSVMPFTVAAGGAGSPRLFHQVFSEAAQDAVAGHASHVIHLLFFEVIEHGGAGETTVKANHNPGFGKSSTQPRQGSLQDADRSSSGACVAGPRSEERRGRGA